MRVMQDPALPEFVGRFQDVTTYQEIEEVMRSSDFRQSGAPERRVFFEDTLIYAEGERHSELKELFRSLMSRDAMAYYELHLLEPVISSVLDSLKARRGADGLVRVELLGLVRVMLHRISAGVTGVDNVDTPERTERFAQLITVLSEAVAGQWTKRGTEAVIAEGRQVLAALVDEFLQPSLDRRLALADQFRQKKIAAEDLPRDVLMTMCLADDVYKPNDATRIPYVWRQCSLFLSASIQTTSQSVPHLIVHLDEWVREHPEDREKLTDPIFLRKAATESLRLHQSSPVKFREAVKDLTLSTGRKVAAGETVALHTTYANFDPSLFGEDARSFNPNREPPSGMMPWGLTFGIGRHMCFGSNLVIGIRGKADQKHGTDGTLINIVRSLYERGCRLDPMAPPRATEASFHDAFESVPVILAGL